MWENTPLLVSCHYRHEATALMLLERGADPAAINEQGATPLLYAALEGMQAVAEKLLESDATQVAPPACMVYSRKTDATSSRTPLQAACENGFVGCAQLLLGKGATPEPHSLLFAAQRGEAAVCKALLPLLLAAESSEGSSSSSSGAGTVPWLSDALAAAAAKGAEETVRALCASGASSAGAALLYACELRGADGPASGEGSNPRERIVAFLIEAGAPMDATSAAKGDGNTPLHVAAARGLSTVADLLLAAASPAGGALSDSKNAAGETPADCANAAGHTALAEKLSSSA